MAISPKLLEEAFQKEIDYFEHIFDMVLANKKITKGQSITIDAPTNFNSSHFTIIKSRYIHAGWTDVTYNSDQGESEWLTFKY